MSVMSMAKVEWLLLKYHDEYQRLTRDSIDRIPLFHVRDFDVFIRIFEELSALSDYHRHESYFKEQVIEYETRAKYKHSLQVEWVTRNEKLAVVEFMIFDYLYLDHCDDPEHLKIRHILDENIHIYIDRNDFKYTSKALEIFDELFWEQEILPERVKQLELELKMKNTITPNIWERE